ncbi:diaminopimelate epimerase [Proteiniphilum sp. UBA5463]|jgi:diaminopimelate epimerase|uniref:diaminopimelate epimerase n=1 Tax=Proteiniphilum sp. UBA5463 TaxID=1947281 RepID=UPI00257F313A|nr:diaminopimelate epimerase [Proteiniphilum sp. UBA5463]
MKFTKMHGTGNDYIYINGFVENIKNPSELSLKLSDRHKGVGSDGLVVILPSEDCDFKMRMFNSDGSESEMCGNASRCVGKYVYEKGMTNKTGITLETLAGVKVLKLWLNEEKRVEKVTVDMGAPVLDASSIPTAFSQSPVVKSPLPVSDDATYEVTCLSMGNPHAVLFMDKIDELDLSEIGPVIEHAPYFPNRTNTEFVEVVSDRWLKMRVWERGAGETLACGTGACAAVVAAVLNGLAGRKATVQLRGGDLEIEWNEEDNRVYLTGDAVTVFEGEIKLDE